MQNASLIRDKESILIHGVHFLSSFTCRGERYKVLKTFWYFGTPCVLFIGWLRSTVEECRLFPGELSCPALDLQLTGDHLCG